MRITKLCKAVLVFCLIIGISNVGRAADGDELVEVGEDLSLSGQAVQGGLIIARTRSDASVSVDGRDVRVSPEGVFLVGFTRDHEPTSTLVVTFPDGRSITHEFAVASREYKIQRVEGVPKRTVTPPEDQLRRIRKETAMIVAARKRDDSRTDFLDGFIWPVTGPISGVYGSQRYYNGKPGRPHYGVDIARPTGTPVAAPAGGIITLAHADMFFSGGTIMIDHGHGLSSAFLHLSKVSVEVDQRVEQGDIVGEIGASGRATGPHLDWRMNLFKLRIDPELLAPPMP